ncbi:hypothetical protein ACIRQP_18110 [Streptomyces sp. NPDC102274]|uniref:hypothetical protein n=1 Tax=Streptomyces sp. NPDC102274 TaxID=3366151 RepID=UPI00382D3D9C
MDRDEAVTVTTAVCRRDRRRASGPVAINAGLHGAGGFGKTTPAKYVAAHRTVQRITTDQWHARHLDVRSVPDVEVQRSVVSTKPARESAPHRQITPNDASSTPPTPLSIVPVPRALAA